MHCCDSREQRLARALGQVKHRLETSGTPEIRIRHFAKTNLGYDIEEEPEMPPEARRAECLQVTQIVQVHREYPVESREVIKVHLPRAQGRQVVTALPGVRNRATVRRLAGVPIADTGRVDEQLVLQSGECRVPAEHGFRRRRGQMLPMQTKSTLRSGGKSLLILMLRSFMFESRRPP